MNETKEKTVPARKTSPGPAGLDGVLIDSCAFTESVGKKEPRPPLHWAVVGPGCSISGQMLGGVFLAVPGGKVRVRESVLPPNKEWENPERERVGIFIPQPPAGPAYTGPITPAMWQIINRWWQP